MLQPINVSSDSRNLMNKSKIIPVLITFLVMSKEMLWHQSWPLNITYTWMAKKSTGSVTPQEEGFNPAEDLFHHKGKHPLDVSLGRF